MNANKTTVAAKYLGISCGGGRVGTADDVATLVRELCSTAYLPAGNYVWDAERGVGIVCGCLIGDDRYATPDQVERAALALAPSYEHRGEILCNPLAAGVDCDYEGELWSLLRRDGLTGGQ